MDSIKFIKTNSERWKTVKQDEQLNNIVFIEDIKLLWTNGVYYGSETNKIKTVTLNELQDLKNANSLIPGQIYEITDFKTTLDRSIGEVVYKDGETHHIQVVALTSDTLSEDTKSILVVPVVVSRYFPPTGDFELIAYKCDWDPDNSIYTEDGEYYKYVGETIEIDGTIYYIWNKYENGIRIRQDYGKSRVLTDTLDINCSIDNPYHIEYYISYEDEINDYTFTLPTEEDNDPAITDSFSRIIRTDKPVYNYNIKMLACDMDPNTGEYGLDDLSWYEYNGDTIDIDGVTYFRWNKFDSTGDGSSLKNCSIPLTTSLDIKCSPSMPYAPEYWLSLDTGELDDEYFDPEKTDIFYQIEYSNLPDALEEIKLIFVETSVKFNLPTKYNFDESLIVNALAFKTKVADGNPPDSNRFAEADYGSMFLYNGETFDLDGKTYYIWDKWMGAGELVNGQYAIDEYNMYPQKLLTDKLYIDCSLNKPYTADYSLTPDGETEDNYQFNHYGDSFVEIKYFNSTTNYIRFVENGWYVRCPELDRDGKFGWAYIDNLIHTSDNTYEWAEGGGNDFGPFPAFMNARNLDKNDFFLTGTLDPQVGDSFYRFDEGDELDTIDKLWGTIIEPSVSSEDIYHARTDFGDGIYYMKDEFGNEAPYDFKHIKFNGVYTFGTSDEDYSLDGFKNKIYNNRILKPANGLFNRINISSKNTYGNVFYPSCVDHTFDSPIKESLIRISEQGAVLIGTNSMVENVTWTELKSLRDNAQLIVGQQYRITDYVATTVQEETTSANHPFDIIVTAVNECTLNENVRAIQHVGDEYFANCNLAAWELKYCLDNDTERFAWADSEGKGVVYYMKDEWNNECPYDFKGIMFARYGINNLWLNDLNKVSEELVESLRNSFCYDRNNGLPMAYSGFSIRNGGVLRDGHYWCYTFNAKNIDDGVFYDASVICNKESIDDYTNVCENNAIKPCHDEYSGRPFLYTLNNIVFNNYFSIVDGYYVECHSNTFGYKCFNNTFGHKCCNNTFSYMCYNNSIGNYCDSNIFGNCCDSNIFGEDCDFNIFGNYCDSNIFGNYCYSNTFGKGCDYVNFSDNSRNTTIESYAVYHISNLSVLFPQIVQTTTPYKAYRIGLNSSGELVCINPYDAASVDTSDIESAISNIESNVSTLQGNVSDIESNISENEEVIAAVFDKTRTTIGADENIKVTFSGTNNLDGCKSLLEAILLLDAKLKNE